MSLPRPTREHPIPTSSQSELAEIALLHERIRALEAMVEERDNTLDAIKRGDIDALVVTGVPEQYEIYTLQNVDQPYRFLIEQIQEGAVILRQDSTLLYSNGRLAEMLGIPTRLTGQKLLDYVLPEEQATFNRMLAEAARVTVRSELTLRAMGGSPLAVHLCLNFLRTDDSATLLCGVITDVSEQQNSFKKLTRANANLARLTDDLRKAQAAAERASEAKSRFLAGITHELRTPLHGMIGYAELLTLEGGLNSTQSERLEAMMAAGEHLLGMINAVLDMSQIEADHLELQPAPVELLDLVRGCLDVVRPAAEAKGLLLSLHQVDPIRLFADATRLRQVLINLLGNAIKFTPAGMVELKVRRTESSGCVRLEVVDTGPGIWPAHQDKLFQTFERLNAEAVSGIEGAGMGLAIAARLMHLMGGQIGHCDNPDGGSIFWVELPPACVLARTASNAAPVPLAGAPRRRVLVVDDEAFNRRIASGFLTLAGHEVVCIDNGAAAVAAATVWDFDVILMDVRMPGMNGLEATRRIRQLPAPRGKVRIVAVTAQAFAQQIAICREAGMNDHVSKPFKQAVLLAALDGIAAAAQPGAVAVPPAGPTAPIFDRAVFDDITKLLSASEVEEHLQTLSTQAGVLLTLLRTTELPAGSELAEAAHKLAGGAGTFGFLAVAAAARRFEPAADSNAPEAAALAQCLVADIEAFVPMVREELATRAAVAT